MPPKKRPVHNLPRPAVDRSIQTEDDTILLSTRLMQLSQDNCKSASESSNEAVLIRRQSILALYIKKLTEEKNSLQSCLNGTRSKFGQIMDRFRVCKTENESELRALKDEMKAMEIEQSVFRQNIGEGMKKCMAVFDGEQKKLLNSMKNKDGKLAKIRAENEALRIQLGTILNAFESQGRLLEVARKEEFNSREEKREAEKKLNDKIYIKTNQKCMNCEVKERTQGQLTDQIAQMQIKIDDLILLKDQEIAERDKINQLLASKLEKTKEEFAALAKNLEKEKKLKRAYCDKLQECQGKRSNSTVLSTKPNTAVKAKMAPVPSAALTPPEENDSPRANVESNKTTGPGGSSTRSLVAATTKPIPRPASSTASKLACVPASCSKRVPEGSAAGSNNSNTSKLNRREGGGQQPKTPLLSSPPQKKQKSASASVVEGWQSVLNQPVEVSPVRPMLIQHKIVAKKTSVALPYTVRPPASWLVPTTSQPVTRPLFSSTNPVARKSPVDFCSDDPYGPNLRPFVSPPNGRGGALIPRNVVPAGGGANQNSSWRNNNEFKIGGNELNSILDRRQFFIASSSSQIARPPSLSIAGGVHSESTPPWHNLAAAQPTNPNNQMNFRQFW